MHNDQRKARVCRDTGVSSAESLVWGVDDVVRELKVSRPTAYRLMHRSGAELATPRRCRVLAVPFLRFLAKGTHDEN